MSQTHDKEIMTLVMNECVARGMEPPFISVAIDSQGFGNIAKIWLDTDQYWDGETLAETPHTQGAGIVHMLVVDGKDQSVNITLQEDDEKPRFRVINGGRA